MVLFSGGYGRVMLNLLRKQKGTMKSGSEFPLTLGRDFSGVVVETGKKVPHYKPGDQVSILLISASFHETILS